MITLEAETIRDHWTNWARTFGADLRATTRTGTAKRLELDALARRFAAIDPPVDARVLEMGCGNGINCVQLARLFPTLRFDGVDLIPEMIDAARENAAKGEVTDRTAFFIGNAGEIASVAEIADAYDVVFTDRCLINLTSAAEQGAAISALAAKVRPGGYLLMIENSTATHGAQNHYRRLLGLPAREVAPFNRFFDEHDIRAQIAAAGLDLVEVEDFSSLHDLILYVLVPAANGGTVDYDHPLVQAAAELSAQVSATEPSAFGSLGQNRLFVCRKRA